MIAAPWTVAVVVPAHDEADRVEASLASILDARVPDGCARLVILVADRCRDRTASLARGVLGADGTVIETDSGSVGSARRIGAASVLRRCVAAGAPLDRTWLLSTDADSTVGAAWIETHLDLAKAGAVAVAGTVAVASFDEHPDHVPGSFAQRYVLGADGTHDHVHGANLGVRADHYERAGGWHRLRTAEDHDLWDRLRALGGPLVSTSAAPVLTSGRAVGRAPKGFASLLSDLGRVPGMVVFPKADDAARPWPSGDEALEVPA